MIVPHTVQGTTNPDTTYSFFEGMLQGLEMMAIPFGIAIICGIIWLVKNKLD